MKGGSQRPHAKQRKRRVPAETAEAIADANPQQAGPIAGPKKGTPPRRRKRRGPKAGPKQPAAANSKPTDSPDDAKSSDTTDNPYAFQPWSDFDHEAHRRQTMRIGGIFVGVIGAILLVVLIVTGGSLPGAAQQDDGANESGPIVGQPTTVSLSAVGDNLMHTKVLNTADLAKGVYGDGLYDFTPLYEGIRDVVETHDINFIDIETPMGGDDKGILGGDTVSETGAPVFNTPSSDASDIASFGFNLASTATNHANDMGYEGIEAMARTWAQHPEVVVAGTYTSEEDRGTIRTFEKNGITFAFLAYTLAVNDPLPKNYPDYAIAFAEKDEIAEDVAKAKEMADQVIVAMSWGAEHYTQIASDQAEYAQYLADLDVDLVIGFHPHVIGPVEWVEGEDDSGEPTGHRTLVAYSVGNLIGGMGNAINNVSGVFTCDFVRDDAGNVSVQNPGWIPTIIHFSGGTGHRVYQLKDYTTELGWTHDVLAAVGDPIQYAKSITLETIDPDVVDIDWGDESGGTSGSSGTSAGSGAGTAADADDGSGADDGDGGSSGGSSSTSGSNSGSKDGSGTGSNGDSSSGSADDGDESSDKDSGSDKDSDDETGINTTGIATVTTIR